MKIANSDSAKVLSEYFKYKSIKNKKIPYITDIAKETKFSAATISRYAREKGFLNFGEMRAQFNKTLGVMKYKFDDHKLLKFFNENKKIAIITSVSTKIIGEFLHERLRYMNIESKIICDEVPNDYACLFITISGESIRIKNIMEENENKKHLIISCSELKNNNLNSIYLKDFMYEKRTSFELFKSIREINEFIQTVLDMHYIELENKKHSNF